VVLDEAAASRLQEADYYRWTFKNEPQWRSCFNESNASGLNGRPVKPKQRKRVIASV
jgi:hypothetical protein